MSKELVAGQDVVFDESQFDLSIVTIGLGWKLVSQKRSWFKRLLGPEEEGFDLDAMAILLDANNKIRNFGIERDLGGGRRVGLVDSDVVFYNNLQHPSQTVWHTGDDLKGGTGGDNEQLIVKLSEVPAIYHKILFFVCIHQGQQRKQHFGLVKNAYIRAVDARGREMGRFNLSSAGTYDNKCTMIFAEVLREGPGWVLRAVGQAFESDSFVEVLKHHV